MTSTMSTSILRLSNRTVRARWAVLVTAVLVFSPHGLQADVANSPTDQESGIKATAVIRNKLERMHEQLADLKILNTRKAQTRARALGFDSVESIKDAQVDTRKRLPVYYVPLDKLRTYDGKDPWPLLEQTNSFIYPIVAIEKEERRSIVSAALVHADLDEKSKEINYHFSKLGASLSIPIRVLNKAKEKPLAKDENCDYFVISIPALNKRLLGIRRENVCDFRVIDLSEEKKSKGKINVLTDPTVQSVQDAFKPMAQEAKAAKYDMPLESDDHSVRDQ